MLNTFWMRALLVPVAAIYMFPSGSANAAIPFSTYGWQRVAPAGAGFSIMMPGAPGVSTKTETTGAGATTLHIACYENGGESYCVAYNDYPVALDEAGSLKGIRDHKVGKGTLISDTDVTMNGHHGKIFTAMVDGRLLGCEIYFVGQRLYQVLYTSGNALQGITHGTAFIKSFHLTR
jgi:hypothetical protein